MSVRDRRRSAYILPAILLCAALYLQGCSSRLATPPPVSAGPAGHATEAPAREAPPPIMAPPSQPQTAHLDQDDAVYPSHPITFVIPWAAGGPLDVGVRLMASFMEPDLGQPLQVVYKPGASSQVGHTEFVHSKPDGYTLTALNSPTTESIYLDPSRQAMYNRASFSPIAAQVVDPNVYIVRTESPYQTIADLLEKAREKPDSVVAGVGGLMGDDHLSLLQFQKLEGVQFAVSEFDGGAPTLAALLGGHIDFMVGNIGDAMAGQKAGTLRVLGIAAEDRSPLMPEVPTLREQGFDLVSAVARGWAAPAGTPPEIIEQIAGCMKRTDETPAYRDRMASLGLPIRFMDTEEYNRYLESEEERVAELLKSLQ